MKIALIILISLFCHGFITSMAFIYYNNKQDYDEFIKNTFFKKKDDIVKKENGQLFLYDGGQLSLIDEEIGRLSLEGNK
jgi:hypothetical protein